MNFPEEIGFDGETRENIGVEDIRKEYADGIIIWLSGSGTSPEGKPGAYRCALDYRGHVKYLEKKLPGVTANQAMIRGAIDALECINKPSRIFLVTPTALGFASGFKGKGPNAALIQQLCESISLKDCCLTEVQFINGADAIKRFVYSCQPSKAQMELLEKKQEEKRQYQGNYYKEKYYEECLTKVVQVLTERGVEQEIIDEVKGIERELRVQ